MTHIIADHKLCICRAGERCTNARSRGKVADVPVDRSQALDIEREINVVGGTPWLSGDGPAKSTSLKKKESERKTKISTEDGE